MTDYLADAGQVAYLLRVTASAGMLISTSELIFNHREYHPRGYAAWKIVRSRPFLIWNPWAEKLAGLFLRYPNFLVLLLLRMVLLGVICWPVLPPVVLSISLGLLVLSTLLLNYRSPFGQDGSDQMNSVVLFALFLGSWGGSAFGWSGMELALWFIALQSCLSYFAAGVIKARGPKWQRGTAVAQIFSTQSYGLPGVGEWLVSHPAATRWLTWSVVVIEVAFPLVILIPFPGAAFFLVWGLVFHLMNAVVMGLNSFVPAFLSTYLAIAWVNLQVTAPMF